MRVSVLILGVLTLGVTILGVLILGVFILGIFVFDPYCRSMIVRDARVCVLVLLDQPMSVQYQLKDR